MTICDGPLQQKLWSEKKLKIVEGLVVYTKCFSLMDSFSKCTLLNY